jgi:hypothetical protein
MFCSNPIDVLKVMLHIRLHPHRDNDFGSFETSIVAAIVGFFAL